MPKSFDKGLFFSFLILLLFGLIVISSVSVYGSFQVTSILVKKGLRDSVTNDFYIWRHLVHVILVIPMVYIVSKINFAYWRRLAVPIFFTSLILLVLVLIPALSNDYGSAKSWLNIPLLPSIQPSEIAKIGLILYLAIWMDKKVQAIKSFKEGFLPFVVLLSILVALIGAQPDFGSILVISCIAGTIFFVAGGSISHIILGGLIASITAWPVVLSNEYIKNRILSFVDLSIDPAGAGYQIKQALITIGSGQWWGVGFGKSVQKFGYLPEVQGDTIFAIAAEELGFLRVIFILFLFLFITWRGYKIALNAPDRFSALVATGITSWIFFQAMINVGVTMAVLPLTGITLPFISYGGSSLITTSIAVGILLNISRYAKDNKSSVNMRRGIGRTPFSINRDRSEFTENKS